MPLSEVFLMDCMEGMKGYPDKYFDLAIVDPPYLETFTTAGCADNRAKKGNYKTYSLNGNKPTEQYFLELKRISKNQIIWGSNFYEYSLPGGCVVWDKDNTGNYSDCEIAYQSFSNAIRKFTYTWNGMIQQDMKNKEDRIHPTQKPVALYKWLLKNYAKPGDKILDTHLGSQSSRIAAYDMGFDFTGYEIDKDYFEAGNKRFEQFKSQLKLF